MGVYINIEMPTTYPLTVTIYPNGQVLSETVGAKDIHGEAVPVPEPHGRLGDLDELKTAFPCGEYVRTESVRATIDHIRTVIPASEEG